MRYEYDREEHLDMYKEKVEMAIDKKIFQFKKTLIHLREKKNIRKIDVMNQMNVTESKVYRFEGFGCEDYLTTVIKYLTILDLDINSVFDKTNIKTKELRNLYISLIEMKDANNNKMNKHELILKELNGLKKKYNYDNDLIEQIDKSIEILQYESEYMNLKKHNDILDRHIVMLESILKI